MPPLLCWAAAARERVGVGVGSVRQSLSHQNPDIVLVHYLNVPAIEDCGKICGPVLCSINSDRKEWLKWSKEELVGQLKPMCKASGGRGGPCAGWCWAALPCTRSSSVSRDQPTELAATTCLCGCKHT